MKWYKLLLLALIFTIQFTPATNVLASGTWGGQDTLHVPISWCAIQGSPAAANPNVNGDTTTDAVLWRRHERPTDNVYVNQTGITFRSAINNAWGSLNFPIITDPNTGLGTQGDVRGEDVNTFGAEFNTLINNCDAAWTALGRAGIGITAVNAGLFHDATGNYVGVIGWGGCNEFPAGTCVAPYDGRVMVIDNNYLFPTVADRTFPPSPADPGGNLQFILTDSLGALEGHEFGHSLSLDHRTNVLALMNPGIADNNADGNADNIALNATEVNALRANSLNVPGLETDPQGQFNPGRFVATRQVDAVQESDDLPPYLDLASVKVSLDKDQNRVAFDQQLFGLLPEEGPPVEFWFLVDIDGPNTGADPEQLKELGVPEIAVGGSDLVIRASVRNRQITSTGWQIRDNEVIRIPRDIIGQLQTLVMYPHFADVNGPGVGKTPADLAFPVHHIVSVNLPADIGRIALDRPFTVQTLIAGPGQRVVDRLVDDPESQGVEFVLENPSFPHCTALADGTPGETTEVAIEGLHANAPIHGLLGPDMVFTGVADAQGGGTIDLPIPADAREGFHLVTVGIDGSALTADCVINVVGKPRAEVPIDPQEFALLRSHEDLLRRQAILLDNLGKVIEKVMAFEGVPTERTVDLVDRYETLVEKQADLLDRFEALIRRATG